jgi:hypothetical protein
VYSDNTPKILSYEFTSYSEAAEHFDYNIMTISKYVKSGKIFKKEWILSPFNK